MLVCTEDGSESRSSIKKSAVVRYQNLKQGAELLNYCAYQLNTSMRVAREVKKIGSAIEFRYLYTAVNELKWP